MSDYETCLEIARQQINICFAIRFLNEYETQQTVCCRMCGYTCFDGCTAMETLVWVFPELRERVVELENKHNIDTKYRLENHIYK